MKNIFFLCCIILNSICFGQTKTDSTKIELELLFSEVETGVSIAALTGKIIRNDSTSINFTTNASGRFNLKSVEHSGFLKVGCTYKIKYQEMPKGYFGNVDEYFSTMDITMNTRIVKECKVMQGYYQTLKFPSLRIKGLLTEIDPNSQDSLNYLKAIMLENPTIIISITSLFEHEKDITPFWRRSKTIQARLIEMGIPKERLIIKIETYSEQTDSIIRERKGGNVIFAIESFDYVPTPP